VSVKGVRILEGYPLAAAEAKQLRASAEVVMAAIRKL